MSEKKFASLGGVEPGDLVHVKWCDASIGKSRTVTGSFEVPVESVGIFVLVSKTRQPTILLAQNCFEYANGFYDVDYTAIPAAWNCEIKVLVKGFVGRRMAEALAESFMLTQNQVKRTREPRAFLHRQQRLGTHGGRLWYV
jgi:hypothetical protein